MNENARKYVYLYKNKELILSLCIKKGIEKEYIKSQIKKTKTSIKNLSNISDSKSIKMAQNIIKTYKKDLYEPKYYLMKNPGKYIVNMYSSFILDDKKLEDTNLYKYIESIKINKNKLTEAIYKINQLEDRRKKNQYLKNISTFNVWKILDYVRIYNKCNLDTVITLDKYYNMERYIITKIDCDYGYYMPVEKSTKQEIYDMYPSTVISSGTQNSCIYSKYSENKFEMEPQYFETGTNTQSEVFSLSTKKKIMELFKCNTYKMEESIV